MTDSINVPKKKLFIKLPFPEANVVENLDIYVKIVKLKGVLFALVPVDDYYKHIMIN